MNVSTNPLASARTPACSFLQCAIFVASFSLRLPCYTARRHEQGMAKRVALITGITGQDGSYLSELLLEKGYSVHGIIRRVALEDPDHHLWRLRNVLKDLVLHSASLESFASLHRVIRSVKPDECYHLAAQSFVSYSFEDEFSTLN